MRAWARSAAYGREMHERNPLSFYLPLAAGSATAFLG